MDYTPSGARTDSIWSFRGADGIRAGWSFLLFAAIYAAASAMIIVIVRVAFHVTEIPKEEISVSFGLIAEGLQMVPALIAVGLMAHIEARRFVSYGLEQAHPIRRYLIGALGGWCFLSLLIFALVASGYFSLDGLALSGSSAVGYALAWLLVFSMTGVVEELVWRGYVQSTLTRGMGFWPAAVLGSLLFATAHLTNPGETFLGIAQVFVAGMVFCLILRVSGSLWLGIGIHAGWDWGQSYFYGTPDSGLLAAGHLFKSHPLGSDLISGGTAGPEGSAFATPAIVGGVFAFLWLLKRIGVFSQDSKTTLAQPGP